MSVPSNLRILEDALNLPQASPAYRAGQVWYDGQERALVFDTGLEAHRQTLGREITFLALNNTGAEIPDGRVVYVSGAQGNRPTIALASTATSLDRLIGIATHAIPNNTEGAVTIQGEIDLNTQGFSAGAALYLSATPGVLSASPGTPRVAIARALNATVQGRALVTQPRLLSSNVFLTASGSAQFAGNVGVGGTPTVPLHVFGANARLRLDEGGGFVSDFRSPYAQGLFITQTSPTGFAQMRFEALTTDGTSAAFYEFFRSTVTTGSRGVLFHRGDGTSALQHDLSSSGNSVLQSLVGDLTVGSESNSADLLLPNAASRIGVGTSSPATAFHAVGANSELRLERPGPSGGYFSARSFANNESVLRQTSPSGEALALMTFDPLPGTASGQAVLRFFRNTNTTGTCEAVFLRGDGVFSVQHRLSSSGNSTLQSLIGNVEIGSASNAADLLLPNAGSRIGVGTSSPATAFHAVGSDPEFRMQSAAGSLVRFRNSLATETAISHANTSGSGNAELMLSANPGPGGSSVVSFHRETNAGGFAQVVVYQGNGSASINCILGGNANSTLNALFGDVVLGSVSNLADLRMQLGAELRFGSVIWRAGAGSPEGVVTAPVGSLYTRTDSSTTLYVKQTGTGNTGWVAK